MVDPRLVEAVKNFCSLPPAARHRLLERMTAAQRAAIEPLVRDCLALGIFDWPPPHYGEN